MAQASLQPLAPDAFTQYVPQTAGATRSGALSALMYLRSLPILRGVAHRVPAHWRQRIKQWLQR